MTYPMNPKLREFYDKNPNLKERIFKDIMTQPEVQFHTSKLVSITMPTQETIEKLGENTSEGLIAYITRVSNPQNQSNESIEGLLNYCCKHGHWSILEHVYMTMEIFTTRDISAQMIRHRSFTFQEFSQRYASNNDLPAPYERIELRFQDPKNRQKSIHSWDMDPLDLHKDDLQQMYDDVYENMERTQALYERLLTLGVAKETARRILPMASATRVYMTGNIRDFIFYVKARNTEDGKAQIEHNYVADSVEDTLELEFPTVYKALFLVQREEQRKLKEDQKNLYRIEDLVRKNHPKLYKELFMSV